MTHDNDNTDVEEIDCLEAIGHLYAYLDGEIEDDETQVKFEQHMAHCKSCYSRAQLEGAINNRLISLKKDEVPETLHKRLNNILTKL